ncbi:MAG: group 1 truncated hemoglobin [Myxococcales bacterium]|nr:group 1 truncated hemoglobin [Myxococcales bacterium]MCB9580065.1 group 1 truncated hemoglobin [Polyangiaceae bacterium]
MSEESLFSELGGEPALRRVIDRFVDRIFDDMMIGFFFRNASRERIKEKEYEFAAKHLGAGVAYTGKPIREAHAPHPIMGGQFMRRLKILDDTLREMGVPERVREHWIRHTESLRPLVTRDSGGRCDPDQARQRVRDLAQNGETGEPPAEDA